MNATGHTTRELQDWMDFGQPGLEVQAPYFASADRYRDTGDYFNNLHRQKIDADGEDKAGPAIRSQFGKRVFRTSCLSSQIAANVAGRFPRKDEWANFHVRQSVLVNKKWD